MVDKNKNKPSFFYAIGVSATIVFIIFCAITLLNNYVKNYTEALEDDYKYKIKLLEEDREFFEKAFKVAGEDVAKMNEYACNKGNYLSYDEKLFIICSESDQEIKLFWRDYNGKDN